MNRARKDILKAMDDLLQDPKQKCDYIVKCNRYVTYMPNSEAIAAYDFACTMAKVEGDTKCYMAPNGKRAVSPVFEVEDGRMYLSGTEIIPEYGDDYGTPEEYEEVTV